MMGSAALNMCAVASGDADGYFEYTLHCWDMAGGKIIVEEAGGVVSDPEGELLCKIFYMTFSVSPTGNYIDTIKIFTIVSSKYLLDTVAILVIVSSKLSHYFSHDKILK